MDSSKENSLIITELCELIIKDCCKQFDDVQNCGLLIDIPDEYETLTTGFAITNNKKESWFINNMQILDKAKMLQEKMNKKWNSMFLIANLKNNQFLVEYYDEIETSWRKSLFDHVGEWNYYMKMICNSCSF